jgi:hypothetical protein
MTISQGSLSNLVKTPKVPDEYHFALCAIDTEKQDDEWDEIGYSMPAQDFDRTWSASVYALSLK